MSRDGGCSDCGGVSGKGMSRGQFLRGGVAAAAAASLGGLGLPNSAEAAHRTERTGSNQLNCRENCPPQSTVWSVPASLLNSLWSDCMPRLMASYWMNNGNVPSFGMASADTRLTNSMRTFLGQLATDIRSLPISSAAFLTRRTEVAGYLENTADPARIPIRLMEAAGFDYILSDWGLDIFMPPRPDNAAELMLYYTYRRTGNPSLGIPMYMTSVTPAVDLVAPTGPSQAWIDETPVISMLESRDRTRDGCIDMAIQCLRATAIRLSREELSRGPLHYDPHGARSVASLRVEEPQGDPRESGRRAVSADTVRCVLESVRCWQISGSVFRGLQVELPRILATKWLEDALEAPTVNKCYSRRIRDDGSPALREILMERLESTLPTGDFMQLEFQAAANAANAGQGDITITNRGLSIPAFPELPVDAGGDPLDPATLNNLLEDIVFGRAGNPVFTDSVRSE